MREFERNLLAAHAALAVVGTGALRASEVRHEGARSYAVGRADVIALLNARNEALRHILGSARDSSGTPP